MENKTVSIEPLQFFDLITHPTFTDVLPEGTGAYDGVLKDFVMMDNVPYKRPIVDLTPYYNIIQRRDASCEPNYKKVGKATLRDIEVAELESNTKMCKHEFYQGALRDWLKEDMDTFGAKIIPFFLKANRTDIASNAWFGDDSRAATTQFSTNAFNGVSKWIKYYINNGTIASAQTLTLTASNYRAPANYAAAFAAIDGAYQAQTELMHNMPGLEKVIYCDEATLAGYRGYMKNLGTSTDTLVMMTENGAKEVDAYNGIPIQVVPIWGACLTDILGAGYHHQVILTIRNNFIFATDKNYGEGPDNNEALVIWYRRYDKSWYYQQFMKAGTQIAYPEFLVYGISA